MNYWFWYWLCWGLRFHWQNLSVFRRYFPVREKNKSNVHMWGADFLSRKCTYNPISSLADRHQIEWRGLELCFRFRHQHCLEKILYCFSLSFAMSIWMETFSYSIFKQYLTDSSNWLLAATVIINRKNKQNLYANSISNIWTNIIFWVLIQGAASWEIK